MAYVMTAQELVDKCVDIAENCKTLYVYCGFGACSNNPNNIKRYTTNCAYNKQDARASKIRATEGKSVFFFDCVNLIKGILWGFSKDTSSNVNYAGAKYNSNGVKDVSANGMIKLCQGVSSDFSTIVVGEAVWMDGHIGVYIGDAKCVECTPVWEDGVQITNVTNVRTISGMHGRKWTKHGKIPYVDYAKVIPASTTKTTVAKATCPYKEPTYQLCKKKQKYGVIKKGDEGVKWLQWYLQRLGYYTGTGADIDGFFGDITEKSVKNFQKAHKDVNGKQLEVDGSVYTLTRGAILKAYNG